MQKTSMFNLKFGFYIKFHPYSQFSRSQSLQYTKKNYDKLTKQGKPRKNNKNPRKFQDNSKDISRTTYEKPRKLFKGLHTT